mmetsp:Transcript_101461/g.312989  ORF Transcript_101461/g.312989 Transcript_101461/m.312989 type:complete len:214 (-) Transcript_101461:725-1366(-)
MLQALRRRRGPWQASQAHRLLPVACRRPGRPCPRRGRQLQRPAPPQAPRQPARERTHPEGRRGLPRRRCSRSAGHRRRSPCSAGAAVRRRAAPGAVPPAQAALRPAAAERPMWRRRLRGPVRRTCPAGLSAAVPKAAAPFRPSRNRCSACRDQSSWNCAAWSGRRGCHGRRPRRRGALSRAGPPRRGRLRRPRAGCRRPRSGRGPRAPCHASP